MLYRLLVPVLAILLLPIQVLASGGGGDIQDLTRTGLGILSVVLFVAAYALVIMEEKLHLRKSKPVIVAAGVIWILVALTYQAMGRPDHGLIG